MLNFWCVLCGMVGTGILNILGVFDEIFSDMDDTISPRRTWSRGSLLKQMNPLESFLFPIHDFLDYFQRFDDFFLLFIASVFFVLNLVA